MKCRIVLLTSCLLVLCLVLGACGSAPAIQEKTKVEVWVTWDLEEGGSAHELKLIADEYNAMQDQVEVVLQTQPSDGFSDKVYMAVSNGVGPDAIIGFANTLPEYVEAGLLADMGQYLDQELLSSRISEHAQKECYGFADGKLHIVPVQATATVLFYNKTLFEELGISAPETWEEVEAVSRIIRDAKQIRGFAAESYTDLAQMLFMQTGADYINEDTMQVGFNTPECEKWLQWFVTNANEEVFASTYKTDSLASDFNSGVLASFVGTCTYENFITPDGFELAVAKTPTGETKWAPSFNRGMIVFKSNEKEEAAICDFVSYFTNKENSARWCMSIQALSPYNDAIQVSGYDTYIAESPVLKAAVETMEYAQSTPAVIGASTVRTELKNMFLAALDGQKTVSEAMADAAAASNEALAGN
jgi:ABC-type glycerol-3-phosphate transport system substrate-binding protein